jgi:hypothetical protein
MIIPNKINKSFNQIYNYLKLLLYLYYVYLYLK